MSFLRQILLKYSALKYKQVILSILLLIAVGFVLLRLFNLRADMPSYITWSGALYTDEGIYSRNAAMLVSTGNWYVKGDLNTAIIYPIYFIFQVIIFKLFGISFESLRLLSAVGATVTICLIGLIVKRYVGIFAALITTLIIATNFLFFAISRFGQAEMLMILFIVLSLSCLMLGRKIPGIGHTVLSSLMLLCAILIKTYAIFAVPMLFFLIWQQQTTIKKRILHTIIGVSILGVGLVLYRVLLLETYWLDYQRITNPLEGRLVKNIYEFPKAFIKQLLIGRGAISKPLYHLGFLSGVLFLLFFKELRQNIAFRLAILWWIFGCLMLSATWYHPERYFTHLVIPFAMILGIGVDYLLRFNRVRFLAYVMLGLIITICLQGGLNIIKHMSFPQYTMYETGQDIRRIINDEKVQSPLLVGHIAGNFTLATNGILSVGSHFDDGKLANKDFRLEDFSPTHFLELGPASKNAEKVFYQAGYKLQFLKKYNVLNNYYAKKGNQPVYFYRVVRLKASDKPHDTNSL